MFSKITRKREDTYKMVINSKDENIVRLQNELSDANDKIRKIESILQEYQIDGYDTLINILKSYKTHKCKCDCIPVTQTKQYKNIVNELSILRGDLYSYKEKNNKLENKIIKYEENIDTSTDINEHINKALSEQKKIYDKNMEYYKNSYKKQIEEIKQLNYIIENNKQLDISIKEHPEFIKLKKEIIDKYKKELEQKDKIHNEKINKLNNKSLPTPSNSKENKNTPGGCKNNFDNKNLNILERCKVYVYKYNEETTNETDLNILEHIASENKLIIKFNSIIAEKVREDNIKLWEKLYYLKVKDGELIDYPQNKQRFKYKYLRCKDLYNRYGENLKRFKINLINIGKLSKDEWKIFLEEFDKLYKETFRNMEACQHKYKDNKICGIFNCNKKHKNNI